MNNEILDHEYSDPQEEIKEVRLVNYSAIILLWLGIGASLLLGWGTEMRVILASLLLGVATTICYTNFKLGVKITLAVILLGILNIVQFFPIRLFLSFGFGFEDYGIQLGLEFVSLIVGIIHILTNREEFLKFLKTLVNKEAAVLSSERQSKVEKFKRRYSNKSPEELEQIIQNTSMMPEAIQAAKELLDVQNGT